MVEIIIIGQHKILNIQYFLSIYENLHFPLKQFNNIINLLAVLLGLTRSYDKLTYKAIVIVFSTPDIYCDIFHFDPKSSQGLS